MTPLDSFKAVMVEAGASAAERYVTRCALAPELHNLAAPGQRHRACQNYRGTESARQLGGPVPDADNHGPGRPSALYL